ncbi:MAG: M48 family metallopeptidase, partial [Acidimicrobiia bacterium]|nr:M48 family metallopeptidase [Acidimicrobiia bacterium]
WLWCWGVTTVLIVFLQFVAPTWIFPLFNQYEPLPEGELRNAMLAYAEKVSFPIEGLFVIDGSRRSTKANAFFTGFGRRKRVALFDTLIDRHEPDELLAIFAHEVGHYKKGHILMGLAIAIAQYGLTFLALSLFIDQRGLFEAFSVDEPSTYAGLLFVGLLFSPIDLALSLPVQALSRRNELQADTYARQTTGLTDELISGLKRLSADHLANLTPHPLYVKRHYSHPPLIDRVRALRRPGQF